MHSIVHVKREGVFSLSFVDWGQVRRIHDSRANVPEQRAGRAGRKDHSKKACVGCHTTNGSTLVGPTWKGMWVKKESTDHGIVTVDENYIRESIVSSGKD